MKQKNRRSQEGFTLAELLIVVAVIAVLVAIAIPIFFGSLKEAQLRVNQANVRSVKAAGIAHILTNWDSEKASENGWKASAKVDAQGNISEIEISEAGPGEKKAAINNKEYSNEPDSEFAKQKPGDSGYDVTVLIELQDVSFST